MKKWDGWKFGVWFLVGVVFCCSGAAMYMSGSWNLDKFYDNGEVFEIAPRHLRIEDDLITVNLIMPEEEAVWNYIYIYLNNVTPERVTIKLDYYNELDEYIGRQSVDVFEGGNIIETDIKTFSKLNLVFENQAESTLWWEKIEFREKSNIFSFKKYVCIAVIIFLVYIIFTVILVFRRKGKEKIRVRLPLDALWVNTQKVWIKIFEPVGLKMDSISEKVKSIGRIVCLVSIFINILYTAKFGDYLRSENYKYYILIQVCFLIILACLNMRGEMRILKYNGKTATLWMLFCLGMCISDFIIDKKFMYTGYWLWGIFGLVFWSWKNAEKSVNMLKEFVYAFEIILLLSCVYCFFMEPYPITGGYIGMTKNENTLGEFWNIAIIVIFSMADELFYKEKSKIKIAMKSMELILGIFFIYQSTCRAAYVFLICGTILFLKKNLWNRKKRTYWKNCCFFWIITVIAFVPLWHAFDWGMKNLQTGWLIENSNESLGYSDGKPSGLIAYAKDGTETHYLENIKNLSLYNKLDEISSIRISIYKKYVSSLNMWGHFGDETVRGIRIGAHNLFLTIAYRYGVVTFIIYILLLSVLIMLGWRYMYENRNTAGKYAYLPIGLTFAFFVLAFLDNVEQPLRYVPWFSFYYIMGFFMFDANKER